MDGAEVVCATQLFPDSRPDLGLLAQGQRDNARVFELCVFAQLQLAEDERI